MKYLKLQGKDTKQTNYKTGVSINGLWGKNCSTDVFLTRLSVSNDKKKCPCRVQKPVGETAAEGE